MNGAAWQTEYSVETKADRVFAWTYMTNIKNWDDGPARFHLDGLFTTGARGFTEVPGQPLRHWQLRDVHAANSYKVELFLDGAALFFEWLFQPTSDNRTLLTQRITLTGENAHAYVAQVQAGFEPNLANGMRRVAAAMDQAYLADVRRNASGPANL